MTLHVIIALPDGRTACADFREDIAAVMRRVNEAISVKGPGTMAGRPADYALIGAWLDTHAEASELCRAHLRPGGPDCGHLPEVPRCGPLKHAPRHPKVSG